MGKTIFAALVAAVLASVATVLVMDSLRTARDAAGDEARRKDAETAKVERERLERRIADLEKRPTAAARVERRPAAAPPSATETTAVVAPPPLSPDGTPYVSRAELEEFAKKLPPAAQVAEIVPAKAVEKKSLEDIAREMNLSAGEEANLRNILRESEEEMIHNLFGDKPLADVVKEAREAKEDPDKAAAMMQGVVQNGIANVGKLMTLENRTKKKVEAVLGADRAKQFNATPRKPVLDPDLEDAFDGINGK